MERRMNTMILAPGLEISCVITGLWQIADIERKKGVLDPVLAAKAMRPYIEAGITTFDMADHYGSAELIAGQFSASYPELPTQFFTKWVPPPGKLSRREVKGAVEKALKRLNTSSLDLLQYHAWNYADPSWLDQLFWLQEMKDEGLIQHLGVTNFDAAHLSMALHTGIQLVSNQVSFSLLDRRARSGLDIVCRAHGVKLLAYGTLAGGFLTNRWLGMPQPEVIDSWYLMKYRRFIDAIGGWDVYQALLIELDRLARKYKVSIANIASRLILDEPFVAGIIIGARLGERSHIQDNLNLFSFDFEEDDIESVNRVIESMDRVPGDCGDEYRRPPYLTASGDLSHHIDSLPSPYLVQAAGPDMLKVLTGTPWEPLAGFARAVQRGKRILISGTTATHGDRVIGGKDPVSQTHFIIDKIEGVLQSLGSGLRDVLRTRIYIRDENDWESVSRAHGERFSEIQPANTLIQANMIGDEYLVEIEAEAERK